MTTINIEMSGYQAKEITDELKEQVAEIGFTLSKHHLDYLAGNRNHDIDAVELQEAIRRLNAIGGLMKMIEDAEAEAKGQKK